MSRPTLVQTTLLQTSSGEQWLTTTLVYLVNPGPNYPGLCLVSPYPAQPFQLSPGMTRCKSLNYVHRGSCPTNSAAWIEQSALSSAAGDGFGGTAPHDQSVDVAGVQLQWTWHGLGGCDTLEQKLGVPESHQGWLCFGWKQHSNWAQNIFDTNNWSSLFPSNNRFVNELCQDVGTMRMCLSDLSAYKIQGISKTVAVSVLQFSRTQPEQWHRWFLSNAMCTGICVGMYRAPS